MSLPERWRKAAARIIWWDFFSLRFSSNRWPHLDGLVEYDEKSLIPDDELRKALIACGYSEAQAFTRL